MPTLEVRRHSIRKPGAGSQLSQEGVELARAVGATMGPFEHVVTTVSPRARETAIAMGFAVDHELVTLSFDSELFIDAADPVVTGDDKTPFATFAELIAKDGAFSRYVQSMAGVWRDLMTPLKSGSVLVIGHSGEIEGALVTCFPHADHEAWGQLLGPCEGARLTFEGEPAYFTSIEFLRAESRD